MYMMCALYVFHMRDASLQRKISVFRLFAHAPHSDPSTRIVGRRQSDWRHRNEKMRGEKRNCNSRVEPCLCPQLKHTPAKA